MGSTRFLYRGGEAEIEEKRSRFIAHTASVPSEEKAQAFLAEMRKKYWDARHNCHAFVIEGNPGLTRCSDDGEPAGTAGRPILDVINGENLSGCIVVVTRYFGGTLLGTGGLVRAYQKAARLGLEASVILEKKEAERATLRTDYSSYGKIQYFLAQEKIPILSSRFTDRVETEVLLPPEQKESLLGALRDRTAGTIEIEEGPAASYALHEGNVILL